MIVWGQATDHVSMPVGECGAINRVWGQAADHGDMPVGEPILVADMPACMRKLATDLRPLSKSNNPTLQEQR